MAFTTANAGSNALDSDVSAAGVSHTFTLTSGQVDKSVDAGVLAAATIGDRVWIDKNGNGVQDDGERQVGRDRGTARHQRQPAENHHHRHQRQLQVLGGGWHLCGQRQGAERLLLHHQNAGSDDAKDSDANSSGRAKGHRGGRPERHQYGRRPVSKGEIGDKVWCDLNGDGIQQSGEGGVSGVKVTLYNEAGVAVGTDTTDSSGLYSFTGLAPASTRSSSARRTATSSPSRTPAATTPRTVTPASTA
jgi:hypothetical protein